MTARGEATTPAAQVDCRQRRQSNRGARVARRRRWDGCSKALAAALAVVLPAAAPPLAAAAPAIWAHRGGPYANGKPRYHENTLPAFQAAVVRGDTLEADARLTRDGVLVVIHDRTLDRTTPCRGRIAARTAGYIRRRCPSDVIGVPGGRLPARRTRRRVAVPTLDELLALVRDAGVTIAIDVKRTSSRDTRTVPAVAEVVNRSGMPLDRVIVGTYRARALTEIRALLPGAATAQGTLRRDNERGLRLATPGQWFGPQWPVSRDFVGRAHALGLRVVPYTLNTGAQMRAAAAAGSDAFLTDDPVKAARVLRSPS